MEIIIGDIICDNSTAECREVVKITKRGVHLSNGNNRRFIKHKVLQEGLITYAYGVIPNE